MQRISFFLNKLIKHKNSDDVAFYPTIIRDIGQSIQLTGHWFRINKNYDILGRVEKSDTIVITFENIINWKAIK